MSFTVLVADDEPNIVISLEFLMKREGYRVLVARDGNEALETARREKPDLVLLDVMMPGKTGFEVCQAVRADEALAAILRERPDLVLLDVMMPGKTGFDVCQAVRADESFATTKIVLLTARGRDTDVAKGMALGATDYLTKPFSTKELAARVRELLQGAAG